MAQAGYFSLFDFTGIPVGIPPTATAKRGVTYGAGRRHYFQQVLDQIYTQERSRSVLESMIIQQVQFNLKLRLQEMEFEYRKSVMINNMITATLLSEI